MLTPLWFGACRLRRMKNMSAPVWAGAADAQFFRSNFTFRTALRGGGVSVGPHSLAVTKLATFPSVFAYSQPHSDADVIPKAHAFTRPNRAQFSSMGLDHAI
jgi:hypothetical protein